MYSTAQKISDIEVAAKRVSFNNKSSNEPSEESPPGDELLLELLPCLSSNKPCHCDCVFNLKTRLAMNIFKYIPRCPYYTTYFAFRRTGVHPPL